MSRDIQTAPFGERLEHLHKLIGSQKFLNMEGLSNEVPFFIVPYKPVEANDMEKIRKQLISRLASDGVEILDVNLYDLSHEILNSEGDWDWACTETSKHKLKEDLQGILDSESVLIPAVADKMAESTFDVMFLSGVGEVFPYIRSHNVLNNLQKSAKDKPTVMFFPGKYTHSLAKGASLDLFAPSIELRDDKYYRADNIYDRVI